MDIVFVNPTDALWRLLARSALYVASDVPTAPDSGVVAGKLHQLEGGFTLPSTREKG
jgi:hypothetical protein